MPTRDTLRADAHRTAGTRTGRARKGTRPAGGAPVSGSAADETNKRLAAARMKARQRGSSALYLIACTFLATAVLRVNDVRHDVVALIASPAHAAETEEAGDKEMKMAAADAKHSPDDTGEMDGKGAMKGDGKMMEGGKMMGGDKSGMYDDAGEKRCLDGAFLAAALERERELDRMALKLDMRRRELEVSEKRVAEQLAELASQRGALQAALGQAESTAEEEAMQLVSIYEKMKPKQAAQIFNQMPPEIAAGFVRRMRKANSALIMANMDASKAYAISLLLAGRSSAVRNR